MRLSSLLFSVLIVFASFNAKAQDGEKLFKQNCAACHTITDKALIGPGLQGVYDRAPSEEWLVKWITDPNALIASGDSYANQVKDFSDQNMTAFGYLEEEQILQILDYVKNPPAPKEVVEEVAVADAKPAAGELSDDTLTYILIGISVLLLLLIAALAGVRKSLTQLVSEKTGEAAPEERGVLAGIGHWMNVHRGWTAVFGLVLLLTFLRWGFGELLTVGVYTGYKPTQPIAFSHKIHAGQNGINCVYCHTSAEKGKTAGIPSLNVCMNCHSYVSEGPSGTEEIAKIYAALDYDPDTRKYGDNPKPVEWVRVHNLTDLSYFNHSQHVVVGKIECQKCHGPIEEMAVVEQHSPLTMGWCINCHRETSVQVADNEYYKDLHERTPDWHNGEALTVDRIGGIECAKCHY
ncbi:cytochrome c3 family protein [Bacteroidota bacterium]